jgi:hypothetical protein
VPLVVCCLTYRSGAPNSGQLDDFGEEVMLLCHGAVPVRPLLRTACPSSKFLKYDPFFFFHIAQAPRTSTLVSRGELHPSTALLIVVILSYSKCKQGQRHLRAPTREKLNIWILLSFFILKDN